MGRSPQLGDFYVPIRSCQESHACFDLRGKAQVKALDRLSSDHTSIPPFGEPVYWRIADGALSTVATLPQRCMHWAANFLVTETSSCGQALPKMDALAF